MTGRKFISSSSSVPVHKNCIKSSSVEFRGQVEGIHSTLRDARIRGPGGGGVEGAITMMVDNARLLVE